MERIGRFVVAHRRIVFSLLVAGAFLFGWRASLLREDLSFETLYMANDPEIAFSDRFASTFENVNDMVAVAITGGDVFKPALLRAVMRMVDRIERIKFVKMVYSITNVPFIRNKNGDLDVSKLVEKPPPDGADTSAIRKQAMAYDLFRRRLLSEDGRYMGIIVQMRDVIGKPADAYVAGLFERLGNPDARIREEAAGVIAGMLPAVRPVLVSDEHIRRLVEQLASKDEAARNAAIEALGALGSAVVRRMGLEDRRRLIAEVERIVREELPAGYRSFVTGINVVERDYARILRRDKMIFQSLIFAVVAVAFYLTFGSLRDMLTAVISLTLSAVYSLGAVQLMGGVIDIINSVVFTMVLVVGTSDIVHMIFDFRSHLEEKKDKKKAAAAMIGTVGFACLMTSLTTACGFFSLYFAKIGTVSRFGLNMSVAILITYVVSLLSSTCLLSWMGEKRKAGGVSRLDRAVRALAVFVVRRRVTAVAVCAGTLAFLAVGFSWLIVETHAVAEVSEDSPTKVNIRAMEHLAGFIGFEVSIRSLKGRSLLEPDVLKRVDELVAYMRSRKETLRTWSVVDYIKTMNRAANDGKNAFFRVPDSAAAADQFLLFYSLSPEGAKEINGLVSRDRRWLRIVSRVHDVGAGRYLELVRAVEAVGRRLFPQDEFEVRVTSEMYLLHVAMNRIVEDMIRSISWAFLLVAGLMTLSLRSVRLGVLAIVPNVIPLLSTLGFMGWTGIALRVGTLVVFSVGFGIAVDDTIHYLLRYRRERLRASSYEEAVIATHIAVGKPIIITSLILMAGFLVFIPATFKSVSHMGILNAFTMATALMADLLVTPVLLWFSERTKRSSQEGRRFP